MSEPLKVLTMDDIVRLAANADRERLARRQWGKWHLKADTLELEYRDGQRILYRVDLERCTTSAQMLDWIFQVRAKTWISPSDVGHLTNALRDTLDPQANLCSWSISRTMDTTAYLRRRYGGQEP